MTTKKTKSPSSATKPEVYVSTDDRIANLEALVGKLASTVEDSINLMKDSRKLPMVKTDEARLEALSKVKKHGDIGESQRVVDFLNPRGQDSGFQPDDVVMLGENSEHYKGHLIGTNGEPVKADEEGEPALGVVLAYMYTRRDGHRKYKVNFPKLGKSSFMEKELVMVKEA